jgi:2',3'-cyclic-nucleotide 2'-phosphodiesterase (5'-nucleotidase family)
MTPLISKEEKLYVVEVDERNYRLDDRISEEVSEINDLISPYKAELDKTMDEVLGYTSFELIKNRPNGSLNNWVADLTLGMVNANFDKKIDFALQNYGGMRISSLAKGDILVRNIFELMPFDNKVSILELDGKTVNQLFAIILEQGGWPVSSGVKIMAGEDGLLKYATINGEPIDDGKSYLVTMPDYIANGNSGCEFLLGQKRNDLELLIREGMITYLRSIKGTDLLRPTLENRIINE